MTIIISRSRTRRSAGLSRRRWVNSIRQIAPSVLEIGLAVLAGIALTVIVVMMPLGS